MKNIIAIPIVGIFALIIAAYIKRVASGQGFKRIIQGSLLSLSALLMSPAIAVAGEANLVLPTLSAEQSNLILIGIGVCVLGMGFGLWHPYWIVFLAIPIFYSIFSPVDKLLRHRRIEKGIEVDIIDSEDEDKD